MGKRRVHGIQQKYNNFRHNNLTTKSLYVYHKVSDNSNNLNKFNDINFYIPNKGCDVKIAHFEKSIIPGLIENNSLNDDMKKEDDKYDIKMFLNDLSNNVNIEDKEFNDFVERINKDVGNPINLLQNDEYFKD